MMSRGACALAALLISAAAGHGQVSHVLPAATFPAAVSATSSEVSSVKGASVEAFPAQFVALQIQAALADPRNARYLDEAERLVGRSRIAPLNQVTSPSPETGAGPGADREELAAPPSAPARMAAALKGRLAESSRRVSLVATELRQAIPPASLWIVSPWVPWALIGALLVLLGLVRTLRRPSDDRSVRVASRLARRGVLPGEVARRTGLSQDVIRLLERRRKRREVA